VNRIDKLNLETARLAAIAVAIACLLQHAWNLEPCTMCIAQRYAFIFIGLLALCRMQASGRAAAALRGATNLFALIGIAASLKIQWAISVPSSMCGRDKFAAFLNDLPWAKAVPYLFKATGVCGDYVPPVFYLPIHIWSLLAFSLILVVTLYAGRAMKKGAPITVRPV
jgi:disulfide bond formation protein DsbB